MKLLPYERPTDPARSDLMRRIGRENTRAEQEVARALREINVRFRRNVKTLPGSPDFANQARRWAIFVHGCFWHRHQACVRTTTPTRNRDFWLEKFEANKKRDRKKARLLRDMGFSVLTIWECQSGDRFLVRRRLARLPARG
jgi:DNA mismatch endonuclease (patch repair protein)